MRPIDVRHIRHQEIGTENGYLGGVLTARCIGPHPLNVSLAAAEAVSPKQEVSHMEIRQRIQSAPTRAIVLVLALIAAVAIALTIAGVRLSAPVHTEKGITPMRPHVVGPGMEPDTRDAYRQSQIESDRQSAPSGTPQPERAENGSKECVGPREIEGPFCN